MRLKPSSNAAWLAVRSAAKRAKLKNYDLHFVEPSLSWAQQLALQVRVMAVSTLFRLDSKTERFMRVAAQLDPLQGEADRLVRFSKPNRLYAYCFCSVR